MKVEALPMMHARRGGPVEEGNVYTNPHGRPHYKIVLGKITTQNDRPYRNVVILKVFATGDLAGACCESEAYISEHNDLVGKVHGLPTLKIEWFNSEKEKAS